MQHIDERLIANAAIRRELLWITAHEKEDWASVRDLERSDPGLSQRMAPMKARIEGRCVDDFDRTRAWAAAWHERYEWHVQRYLRAG